MRFRTVLLGAMGVVLLSFGSAPVWADTWPTYTEIGTRLAALESTYPTLCRRYSLGLSVQGRTLWAINISDNVGVEEDEPEFKYISTMHGDEITGVMLCMNLADYLLENYGSNPQATSIVDNVDLWIVPLMNPDGYDRGTRTRYNANGVDLNRDFPDLGDPNTTAGRAIETAHIMNWSAVHSFVLSANFHGGALVANYPYDNDDTGGIYAPDNDMFIYVSEQYSWYNQPMWNSSTFFHGITNGAEWYMIWGGMQDWNYHFMGCNEVTIEVSVTKQPPASQITTFWNDNRESMMAYIETCLTGVRGLVFDAGTGLPVAATIIVTGRDHEVYTDPDVGDYHRMLRPGTYTLTFEAAGFDPVIITDVVVGGGDATRLDVYLGPPPPITYPNGGEILDVGTPIDVTWSSSPTAQFQVQYTTDFGDLQVVTDDFEDGSLGPDYTLGGDANWYVSTTSAHTGIRSARAGNISDNETVWMTRTVGSGDLSFWYRVSSEENYDFFDFYVDGDRRLHVAGEVGWTSYSTTLGPGSHELKWEFDKDRSLSEGNDTVWIDDLEMTLDNTVWTDIVALTDPGTSSVSWTPADAGTSYKVRLRVYMGSGMYGDWDESDSTFEVRATAADGDYDDDGDVDLADFAGFQVCFVTSPSGNCLAAFDFDGLGDVDQGDLAVFVGLLEASGPGG